MKGMMISLINLQDCDAKIMDIQQTKEQGPARINDLKEKLDQFEKDLSEELGQIDANKKEKRQAEQDIMDLENSIEKSKAKLANIKSNKEYRAVLKEIDDLNTQKSFLEDRVLEIMEGSEAIEEKYKAVEKRVKQAKTVFNKERNLVLKEVKLLEQELQGLEAERSDFCKDIDIDLLKRYNELKKHKAGIAVSSAVKGVCQACHLGIPPQKFNELIRGDGIMTCPNCTRIIYWGEDKYFQNINKEV